jgi:hypothetical protein
MATRERTALAAVLTLVMVMTACSDDDSVPDSTASPDPVATTPATTTAPPPATSVPPTTEPLPDPGEFTFADVPGLAAQLPVPADWALVSGDDEDLRLVFGQSAALYDSEEGPAGLLIVGDINDFAPSDPGDLGGTASQGAEFLMDSFFPGPAGRTFEDRVDEEREVLGNPARLAQISAVRDDGSTGIVRVLVVGRDVPGPVYIAFLYEAGFPSLRVAQGLAALEQIQIITDGG